jgi:SWI/SNF-related matrix-associated actin-dependent regulator of chromatin subfamily A member 5
MLRRTKGGVSSQLTVPPRIEQTIYVPLSPAQKFWTKALLARTESALLAEIFEDFEVQSKIKKGKGKSDTVKLEASVVKSEGGAVKAEAADGGVANLDDGDAEVRANVQRAIEASKKKDKESGTTSWTKLMNLFVPSPPDSPDPDSSTLLTKPLVRYSLIQLRKVCDHPYLLPGAEAEPFEIAEHIVQASSKLVVLDKLLASIIPQGEKVLIFSQFTMMLDILEDFMQLRGHKCESRLLLVGIYHSFSI